jgi:lysophospholipase L1-like esterase
VNQEFNHSMKNVFKGVLSLLLALLAVECASRVAATLFYDATTQDPEGMAWYQFSPEFGWTGKPGYKGPVTSRPEGEREFDNSGFVAGEMEQFDDSTKTRIVFIGDSNTFGYEIPKSAGMASLLERLLPDVVTINLSLPAYSSYQGMLVTKNVLSKHKADLAIISFNFNDRRFVGSRDEQDSAPAFARYYDAFQQKELLKKLDVSYSYRAVRYVLRSLGFVTDEYALPAETSIDSLLPRVSPANYRAYLIAMAEELRARHITPVFLLLGDNPTHSGYLRRGIRLLREGKTDSAINALKTSEMQFNSSHLLSRKLLAQAYERIGDTVRMQEYRKPFRPHRRFNGGDLIEFDSTYNDIMRDVAREQRVELVDGKAVLNAEPSVFFDSCHFDEAGHRRVAELLREYLLPILAQRKHGS